MKQATETKPTMTCPACQGTAKRFAVNRNGSLRFRCVDCKRTFTEEQPKPFGKMTTPVNEALIALGMLLEGNSVRATERLTGLHRDTILRLLVAAGEKCEKLMGRLIVNVPVKDVQADEIWGYVSKKEAHKLPTEKNDDSKGDAYCYVAMERHSKLVLNFALGRRNQATTDVFIEGLRHATSGKQRFQITTDGFQPYVSAITTTLSDRCDYAMHIKVYGTNPEDERRYSPAEVVSSEKVPIMGNPEKKRICTSHIERQNLTIRMQMRRMTRLTNAFSKKWDNMWSAYCLWFAYYNFCRVHQTLRVTPAMEAGLTNRIWKVADLLV
jgi:transposase-like protein/IS1 family transposase